MCRDIYDFAKVIYCIDYNPLEGLQKFLQQGVKQNMSHVSEQELPALLSTLIATQLWTFGWACSFYHVVLSTYRAKGSQVAGVRLESRDMEYTSRAHEETP